MPSVYFDGDVLLDGCLWVVKAALKYFDGVVEYDEGSLACPGEAGLLAVGVVLVLCFNSHFTPEEEIRELLLQYSLDHGGNVAVRSINHNRHLQARGVALSLLAPLHHLLNPLILKHAASHPLP